ARHVVNGRPHSTLCHATTIARLHTHGAHLHQIDLQISRRSVVQIDLGQYGDCNHHYCFTSENHMTNAAPTSGASTIETPSDSDRAGKVESHGIDFIPSSERHGRARELFTVWAAPNVSYLSLVVGGALVLMGLSLWQAVAVIVVGNLFSVFMGLVAISGPAAGAPSEVIMRAMFGIRGNRVNIAISGWFVSVLYLALNWAAAAITGFGLYERLFGT